MTLEHGHPDGERLVQEFWRRLWVDRDLESMIGLLADPYVRHNRDGTLSSSPAEYAERVASVIEMICGTRIEFHDLAEIADRVWVRLTLHGVNIATTTDTTITWLSVYRIYDGRIAEVWSMHQTDLDWESVPT